MRGSWRPCSTSCRISLKGVEGIIGGAVDVLGWIWWFNFMNLPKGSRRIFTRLCPPFVKVRYADRISLKGVEGSLMGEIADQKRRISMNLPKGSRRSADALLLDVLQNNRLAL